MSQQLRVAALLRQAAELLDGQPPTTTSTTSSSTSSSSINSTVAATARGLFGPYRNTRPFQRKRGRADRVEPAVSYWKHKLSVVPRYTQKSIYKHRRDCPVCGERFSLEILSVHAATCGDTSCNDVIIPRTLLEAVKEMRANIDDKTETPWTIKVVRRLFSTTAIEQLEETELEDWNKTLRVHFIGEEGLDAGGLQFKGSPVFEGNTFSFKPNLLDKKEYCLIGKATAILNGHPGPRCLNQHITKYILEGVEPDFRVIPTDEIQRLDVRAAIKQIEDATTETVADVFNETISLLEETGYSELLTAEKKQHAVSALKGHFLLYRVMASINQFKEGLKLHGILELLQQHTKEANSYLSEDCNPTAHDVGSFFIPEFSTDADQKATEEMIIYNWN